VSTDLNSDDTLFGFREISCVLNMWFARKYAPELSEETHSARFLGAQRTCGDNLLSDLRFNRHGAQQSFYLYFILYKHYYYYYCPNAHLLSRFTLLQVHFNFRWPDAQLTSLMSTSASGKQKLSCLTEVTTWPRSPPPSAPSSIIFKLGRGSSLRMQLCREALRFLSDSVSLLYL
jgi:hypothetical protein